MKTIWAITILVILVLCLVYLFRIDYIVTGGCFDPSFNGKWEGDIDTNENGRGSGNVHHIEVNLFFGHVVSGTCSETMDYTGAFSKPATKLTGNYTNLNFVFKQSNSNSKILGAWKKTFNDRIKANIETYSEDETGQGNATTFYKPFQLIRN
jgi:hypothetical protein